MLQHSFRTRFGGEIRNPQGGAAEAEDESAGAVKSPEAVPEQRREFSKRQPFRATFLLADWLRKATAVSARSDCGMSGPRKV